MPVLIVYTEDKTPMSQDQIARYFTVQTVKSTRITLKNDGIPSVQTKYTSIPTVPCRQLTEHEWSLVSYLKESELFEHLIREYGTCVKTEGQNLKIQGRGSDYVYE